ncbi:MAG: UvrD-helicase domain-containing protein [Bacteroidetes bacterium]|nr:UvrD-helicase domain-containing protein [Bacteroidota bacterium]
MKKDAGQIDLFATPSELPDGSVSHGPQLVDAQARLEIATVLDKNVVVLAGAGAGKTHELIERMVATVASGNASVQSMAAITFTRKAAGEMKTRFARRLQKAADETDRSPGESGRLRVALGDVDQCFIGTIHAFCARLLRERPLDAGLSPDFTELDERDEASTQREAWDAFIEDYYARDSPALSAFLDTGIALEDLFSFFQTRVSFSEVSLKDCDTRKPDVAAAVEAAALFVQHVAEKLPAERGTMDHVAQIVRRADFFLQNRGLASFNDQIEFVLLVHGGLSGSRTVTLNRWPDSAFARNLRDKLVPALVASLEPVVTQWREYVYSLAAPIVDDAQRFYTRYRRDRNLVTFQDLLEITVEMLKTRRSVRRHFRSRFITLFVDEFQDTDPLQAEMLLLLTSNDPDETDWMRCVPVPGSLFIVGDEKQSIYRFRRADIEVFRAVVAIVRESGGLVVELTTSFRSLGNLCRQINDSYRVLFDDSDPSFQASFAPLSPWLADGDDPFCVRRLPLEKHGRIDEKAEREAELIAEFIHAAVNGKTEFNGEHADAVLPGDVTPGSFMLISRRRKRLSTYAAAMERRGIPYDLTGGDSLGALPELSTLIGFLEVLLYPDDAVKFFAYLRGPLVGLSDADLYAYKCRDGRFSYYGDLPDGLPQGLAERIGNARTMLRYAEDDLASLAAGAAFERIIDRLGLIPFAASQGSGSYRAGSLFRVLSFVRMWDQQGLGWVEIVKQFKDLMIDDVKAIEGMTLDVGRPDVVRILNIHQAKGLEADVVFLVDAADSDRPMPNSFHLARLDGEPRLSLPLYRDSKLIGAPPGWSDDDERELGFLAAEQTRLTYVAATRAKRLLVAGAYESSTRTRGVWGDLTSCLSGVPELQIPHVDLPPHQRDEPRPLAIKVRERQRRLDQARVPSYELSIASGHDTEMDHDDSGQGRAAESSTPKGSGVTEGGMGTRYGRIVHRLLQEVSEGRLPKPAGYIEGRFRDHPGGPARKRDLIAAATDAVKQFESSSILRKARGAAALYTEVPFAAGGGDAPNVVVTSGVIDLIYRDDAGWHIVDYKTDRVSLEGDRERLLTYYGPQVRLYAAKWQMITGEPVASAGLWLVDESEYLAVDLNTA